MDGAVVSSVDATRHFDALKKVADDINSRIDDINKELGTDLTEAFALPQDWMTDLPGDLPDILPICHCTMSSRMMDVTLQPGRVH